MQLHIRHETLYTYTELVERSIQNLRLTPRQDTTQRTLSWHINAPGKLQMQTDAHGNIVHLLTLDQAHRNVRVLVTGVVETNDNANGILLDQGSLSPLAYLAATELTRPNEAIIEFAQQQSLKAGDKKTALLKLAGTLSERIRYVKGATDVHESAAQAFARGQGVCQDHAHVFIACCRASGIPARYVSGYLYTADGHEVDSHAWVDAWLGEGQGWLSIDITNHSIVNGSYCRLAVGRDYLEACPIRGVRKGGGLESMRVSVAVSSQQQ